ncbi:FxsA family protein [Marinospirillum sp.]|uniref:FxsA family protein n=1 Tax=Marinospirillum sp. TaxID=2183934 RepID=UPI00384BE3B6
MPLLFLILIWPLAEIWLMIQVGQQAGAMNTLLLIITTAVLGLLLVQLEWRRLALTLRTRLREGKEPLGLILETAAVGLAGVLLFIPGFISDFLGVLFLLPFTRKFIIRPLKNKHGTTTFQYRETSYREKPDDPFAGQQDEQIREGKVLEGEYQRKDDKRP